MWEVQVHDDGEVQIRKVPASYNSHGITLVFQDSDSLVSEVSSYGKEDADIEAAMQEAECDEFQWITVG